MHFHATAAAAPLLCRWWLQLDLQLPSAVTGLLIVRDLCSQVSLVKGLVSRALARDTAAIERDRESAAKLAAETAAMAAEVTKLKTQPHVFQNSRWVAEAGVSGSCAETQAPCPYACSPARACTPTHTHTTPPRPLTGAQPPGSPLSCRWSTLCAATPSTCARSARTTGSAPCAPPTSSGCRRYAATCARVRRRGAWADMQAAWLLACGGSLCYSSTARRHGDAFLHADTL